MELEKCLNDINKDRERIEAPFVMCLWKDPILYDDYKKINEDGDQSIITEDAKFYFELGKAMYKEGYRNFDEMTVSTFLNSRPAIRERFESYGGFREVEQLKALCDTNNIDAYYEGVAKLNILSNICTMFFKEFKNMDKFKNMTSQGIYDLFEYKLNNSSLSIEQDVKIEDLTITDEFIQQCDSGEEMGLDYSENCPILCNKTMGLPIGDIYLVGGYSGVGKSSFIFENMVITLSKQGTSVAVISNEMTIDAYQKLLLVHILYNDLRYGGLTRKKIKQGHFNKEQKDMIKKAQEIQKEKYNNIKFIKLYDSDINKVLKIGKRLSRQGIRCLVYDTMKSSDDSIGEGSLWQQILLDSRRLFQLASKEQISIVMAYQLAIHTENVRYTSSSCLSNAKQIKEVMSEQVFLRKLWDDEKDESSKFYCQPHRFKKVGTEFIRTPIELDKEKKYLVAFLDKTRNDEDGLQFLYEWNARFNKWVEIGNCIIVNSHERY